MDWIIKLLVSLFKSRREHEREEHAEDRQDVQDALAEWRALYAQNREERALLAARVALLETQHHASAIKQIQTEALLASQTLRLDACLEECKECHESRERLEGKVEELQTRLTGMGG